MSYDAHSNFAYGTVVTAPSPGTSGTTVVIGTTTFAQFPDPSSTSEYNIVVWASGTIPLASNAEVMRVVAKGTNGTIDVERAQESSSNRSVAVGDQVGLAVTKKTLTDVETSADKPFTWVVESPAVGTILGPRLNKAFTAERIDALVSSGTTVTFNIEEVSTIGSAGSDLLSSDLVVGTAGTAQTSFADSSLGSASWLQLAITAVSGSPGFLSVSLKVTN